MRVRAAVVLAMTAGCTCGRVDEGRVVQLQRFRTLISDTGREEVPFDVSGSDVSALLRDDAGLHVVYPEVTGPGEARFTAVPDGSYVLSLNDYNLVTNENALDLGLVNLGRANAALVDGAGTVLALDVTGLSPWVPLSDVLQVTAENAGYVAVNAQSYAGAQPDGGATAARFPIDYWTACSSQRALKAPLVDADAGDRAMVTQLTTEHLADGGFDVRTLVRAAALPAFTVTEQATTAVAAALAPVVTQRHVALDYRQSAFDVHRASVHASATAVSSSVTLSALPYTAEEGAFTAAPDLALLRPLDYAADITASFDTGDPFPASWPRFVTVRWTTQVSYDYPDGGSRAINTSVVVQDLWPQGAASPLVPRVSPPLDVRIDGQSGSVRAVIRRTPTLSWNAPQVGTPTTYAVTLFHLSRVGAGPVIRLAEEGLFETPGTSIDVPFGDLTPGEEYVFGVTAFDSPNAHVERAPFKGRFPFGAATALTTLLKVDPTLQPSP